VSAASKPLANLMLQLEGVERDLTRDEAERLLAGAREVLDGPGTAGLDADRWRQFLSLTRHPRFLTALPAAAARLDWSEAVFRIIEDIGFSLGDLLEQRTAENPERVLFQDLKESGAGSWSYKQIRRRVRSIAAVLLKEGIPAEGQPGTGGAHDRPRVALLCENGIGSASCDLACLCHDIFVSPLNIHFNTENLAWIFDRLDITTAICDHPDRLEKLLAVREKTRRHFKIFALHDCPLARQEDIQLLEERRNLLDRQEIRAILDGRPRMTMREVCTVMFTSGSTGRPKGVAFNQHNLVSKRFARAAALPEVGRDEVMLCYLPLFHTFGRYLEMLGTIFWGGTYVFAGNPSAEALLAQFQVVRPTALISVPVRWVQIRDRVLELADQEDEPRDQGEVFREVVGGNLRWGLSAAGYLDPRVFRFFHRNGVALCSGFGMTEGTGGLTMTPPDDYVENSVGVPLPGVAVRFSEEGELQIAGPYIARYLPEEGPPGDLSVEEPESDEHWLATGDLFVEKAGGHLEIVDRIKDIYKNNRGQTIAPRKVESLFDGVPGIKRTFLAGDGRSFNTLLIVPSNEDEVLRSLPGEDERREYFQQIVTTANPGLAAFERVVNFAVLDRDFSEEQQELTAKGSYRRKAIEKNFADIISDLYQTNEQVLRLGGYEVRIPRWFFRDLGVLESAVKVKEEILVNKETGARLLVAAGQQGRVRIGDLEYHLKGSVIDLGLLSRQPLLWMANTQLIAFCPCKVGWDTDPGPFSEQVWLPERPDGPLPEALNTTRVDRQLDLVNTLCCRALYGDTRSALAAIIDLDDQLGHVGARQQEVIRRRLEALAGHPDMSVRCRAYQVLVLDQPVPDYLRYLPTFIESGRPFLDEQSFKAISRASIEPRRLLAFRQRLHSYRTQLEWPASDKTRHLFQDLFRLLADFGRFHPEFYGTIREELVTWIMHKADPELSEAAAGILVELSDWFEEKLCQDYKGLQPEAWQGKIVFQEGLSEKEVGRLQEVLVGTTFLKQSIMLAFEGEDFDLDEVGPGGIWVSRIISRYEDSRYRVSINTLAGKHFDLQVIIRLNVDQADIQETIYWYIMLRGYPFGTPMLPNFGCCRPELGAVSLAYVSDLTVWEKIREFSSVRGPGTSPPTRMRWHQLMVRAVAVVVKGWRNSGKRIIPGLITPNNIVVPDPDFRLGAIQNNLSGWRDYTGPLSLIRPIWRNMYQHTISHYPWSRNYLNRDWVFESFVEALGVGEAMAWLKELREEIGLKGDPGLGHDFQNALNGFIESLETRYYLPLALKGAIGRFEEWERVNAQAPLRARLEILEELGRLYRLNRLPEIARFTLFRNTYFRGADLQFLDVFDRLLTRMFRYPKQRAVQMVELSDLGAAITDPDDRIAFNRLVFPHRERGAAMEIQTVGDPERSLVIVRSTIRDHQGRSYTVGEPSSPAEVGQLYSLFLQSGFPKTISETDRYFVVTDEAEQIIGGAVYRLLEDKVVFLDGIVVTKALAERGIAWAVLDDFVTRMTSRRYKVIKTHFFLRRFYQQHGFRLDNRWGGLVRFL
jgi:long-chain acyl-CoA synthetase